MIRAHARALAHGLVLTVLVVTACSRKVVHRPGQEFLEAIQIEGNTSIGSKDLRAGLAPRRVQRLGGIPDPYLVVAADKGTASFSDIANEVAVQEYDFWLGDAFASGGSCGYDHKKYGITARGAWESVKRHFNDIGFDYVKRPFSVVGIGDMSGDVFGNGLLLSPQMKLLADGIIRARYRESRADPSPITPGTVYEYAIDLWSTSVVLAAGHRLRVDIASANFPRFDRNPNTGHALFGDTELQAATQTILHDAAHPSHVVLPVIPR